MSEQLTDSPPLEVTAPVPNGRRRLTRADIRAAEDAGLKTQEVDVPEWGGYVVVKAMTGTERDAWEASMVRNPGTKKQHVDMVGTRASLVQKSCVEPDGSYTFSEKDIPWLSTRSAAALQRVFTVAQELSGVSDEAIEEITQGLKDDPSAGAGSTSP